MSNQLYINFNGFLYKEDEQVFTVKNRAFKYGDALFESIRIIDGKACYLEDHFIRLKKGMQILKMHSANISFNDLKDQIEKLIEKNHIRKGGRIRITVFRSGEGAAKLFCGGLWRIAGRRLSFGSHRVETLQPGRNRRRIGGVFLGSGTQPGP